MIVHTGVDEVKSMRQDTGPYPIDGSEIVSFGCRHTSGEVLDEEHWRAIQEHTAAVRNGDTEVGVELVIENRHGGPVV
ncbi:MAG: hypothetical protein ACR2FE_05475 [Aeromicrobium sp.]